MFENLEIEFKTLLKKTDFMHLLSFYHLNEKDSYTQVNTYFDTKKEDLKNHHMGLRIRQFETRAEQTLKVPANNGKLEITDALTNAKAHALLLEETIQTPSAIEEELKKIQLSVKDLKIIGTLQTTRYEVSLPIGLLALDYSTYYGLEDYELELEVSDFQQGRKDFAALLAQHQLSIIKGGNKIQRMLQGKRSK